MADDILAGREDEAPGRPSLGDLAVRRLLARAEHGSLTLTLPGGSRLRIGGVRPGPAAQVDLRRWRGLWRLASGGHVGFAEAYIAGDCDCPDLNAVLAWALANDQALGATLAGTSLRRWTAGWQHRRRANSRRGSRRNIAAHYDLGNDFYAAWLDRDMSYSSGLYRHEAATLEEAQEAKLARIVELLGLSGGERVLEIGCGWGGLAERLASRHGCRVTAITLSREQLRQARERLAGTPAAALVEVRLQDYRDVAGQFDRIVSVEMIEAVGAAWWPVYFAKLRSALVPGGTAVLQAITIAEAGYASYASQPDFIQRYIFPGGMLPTRAIMAAEAARAGLACEATDGFAASYARTLADWRTRFLAAWPELERQGFDERFRRMWQYYLCYCETGFRSGLLDVGHYRLG